MKVVYAKKLFSDIYRSGFEAYNKRTPMKLKIIDLYLFFVLLTGAFQLLYAIIVGSFPFNSFLSGFISTIGCFVLTVGLRMHLNSESFEGFYRPERAIADWLFCNVVFHFTIFSFLG